MLCPSSNRRFVPKSEVRQLPIRAWPMVKTRQMGKDLMLSVAVVVGPAGVLGGTMIHWIESQSISAIIWIVFALCYAFAGVVFGLAAALSRRHIAEQLKTISPVTLTPLAVILGLLIVFLAARVWENVGRANEYIEQEAAALSRVILLANALPTEVRTKVRTAIIQHVDFVLAQDWPEMASVRANQRRASRPDKCNGGTFLIHADPVRSSAGPTTGSCCG